MNEDLVAYAAEVEKRVGLPTGLLRAVISRESSWKTNAVNTKNSNKTVDAGIAQINSVNWKEYGITSAEDLKKDPKRTIEIGADILKKYIDQLGGDIFLGVAAYNGGVTGVKRILEARAKGDFKTEASRARAVADYASDVLGRAVKYGMPPVSADYLQTGLKMLGFGDAKPYLGIFAKSARANAPKYLKPKETAFEPAAPVVTTPAPTVQKPIIQKGEAQAFEFVMPEIEIPTVDESRLQMRDMFSDILGFKKPRKKEIPDAVSQIIEDELRSI